MADWVVGVDPGLSFGLFALCDGRRFAARQASPKHQLGYLDELLAQAEIAGDDVLIAMERFAQGSRRHTHQPDAQRSVGAVLELASRYGAPVVLQAPADAKAFAPNERLRELGMWTTARDVDAPDADDVRDAARHALLCLATHRAQTYVRLLDELDARRRRASID